ncbi:MAG: type II toxin-antitoxin system HicB family antitoxin [Lachnospiraceae bacterium]|nr:type II toxin-antitoxin system HicB family antitoxin [Lachnospiraceae bacterium]
MTKVYPAIFTRTEDKKDTYLIDIPDLNGATEGYGLADAIHMARDYIGCKLYDLEESDYPASTPIESIDISNGKFHNAGPSIVSMVDIDIDAYRREMDSRPVRRNVSLPNWLNKKANEAHINVSRVLQEALIEKLNTF